MSINISFAQIYRVDYKALTSKLLPGSKPNIYILEDIKTDDKLYNQLIRYNDIFIKYELYSTEFLNANKNILGADFNPADTSFLKTLNNNLGAGYLLKWDSMDDTGFVHDLTIYSTQSHNRIYEEKIFNSINSTPSLDIKELLLENKEPVYTELTGKLAVSVIPMEAAVKIFNGKKLLRQWKGDKEIEIVPGSYKLAVEDSGYVTEERELEIAYNKTYSVNTVLKRKEYIPPVTSTNGLIKNIKVQNDGNKLKIYYDLAGEKGDQYDIDASVIDKATNKKYDYKFMWGDLNNVSPAGNKLIVWYYKNDLVKTPLDKYKINLSADKNGGVISLVFLIVIVGGALAALLLSGK